MSRVVIISGSMPLLRCGIGYYTKRLLNYLNSDITLLTTEGLEPSPNPQHKTLYTPGWRILHLPHILKQLRHEKPNIIHIQYPAKGYKRELGINKLPYLIRLLMPRTKLVVTLHEYHGSGILGKTRNFITALSAHQIIVSNNYDLKALPGVLRSKSMIIPIGSNIPKVTNDSRAYGSLLKINGLKADTSTVVFMGFPFPNKGLEILIDAMTSFPDLQLLMLCQLREDNAYEQKLQKRISNAVSNGAGIGIAGFLDDKTVSIAMQNATYFVLPQPLPLTAKSGTTIAAIEHGLVVVSTAADPPLLNKPYQHMENAYLLKTMDTNNLVQALQKLQSTPNLLAKLQTNTAKLADYYAWQGIADRHDKMYENLSR